MRLLECSQSGEFSLTKELLEDDIPSYAILSHTWGPDDEEVVFKDMIRGTEKSKLVGYNKIRFCGEKAESHGLRYFWVDTCCIDKSNLVEVQEAINLMFSWYSNAARCYVFLSDVSSPAIDKSGKLPCEADFRASRWFTRGWTLQELLAPRSVEFFSREGNRLGSKKSLQVMISEITGISIPALQGTPLYQFTVDERLSWIHSRNTTRKEDKAYSMLGIFDVHMSLIYGEGSDNAFKRLRKKIAKLSNTKQDLAESQFTRLIIQSNNSRDFQEKFALGFHLERVHAIPHFTARPEYMAPMDYLLPQTSADRKVLVLYGLGGIGKTQLALQFAKQYQSEFSSIFFLDGSSRESLQKSFALIYHRILEGEDQTLRSDLPEKGQIPREVTQWLAQEHNNRWLMIFDNIDKEASDECGFDIASYFPPKDHGSILITTRLAPLTRLGRGVRIGRMNESEAVSLLDGILGETQSLPGSKAHEAETKAKQRLLDTLDGLPLAISQAGHLINSLNLKLETYLELYTSSKRDAMDLLSGDFQSDAEKRSIRTTWQTSLDLLKRRVLMQPPESDYLAAYSLLKLFAYFEPSDLNYNILKFGVIGNDIPTWFQRTFSSKLKFFTVIKILLDLCLIDNNGVEGSYSMHRVVHDWLCNYVCVEINTPLLCLAVGAISYAAPLIRTDDWLEEQQQLALHALHIHPRLRNLSAVDFLVQYDKMSPEQLSMVASLLDEPVKCWELMKFDCTLTGISRLLKSTGRSEKARSVITETLARTPATLPDLTPNPVHLLLRYEEVSFSLPEFFDFHGLADNFFILGSPSWAIKTLNLCALKLASKGQWMKAAEFWGDLVDKSRSHTGSLFIHPTWMLFRNLNFRTRYTLGRRKLLFEKYREDAMREKSKVGLAKSYLDEIRWMESLESLDSENGVVETPLSEHLTTSRFDDIQT